MWFQTKNIILSKWEKKLEAFNGYNSHKQDTMLDKIINTSNNCSNEI